MKYRLLNSTKALVTLSSGLQFVCTYPGGAKAAQTALEALGATRESLAERLCNTLHDTAALVDGSHMPEVDEALCVNITGLGQFPGLLPGEVLNSAAANQLRAMAYVVADYCPYDF